MYQLYLSQQFTAKEFNLEYNSRMNLQRNNYFGQIFARSFSFNLKSAL